MYTEVKIGRQSAPLQRFVAQMQPNAGFAERLGQADGWGRADSFGGTIRDTHPDQSGEHFFEADFVADQGSAPGRLAGGNLECPARTEDDG
jgi:hypothetical protein